MRSTRCNRKLIFGPLLSIFFSHLAAASAIEYQFVGAFSDILVIDTNSGSSDHVASIVFEGHVLSVGDTISGVFSYADDAAEGPFRANNPALNQANFPDGATSVNATSGTFDYVNSSAGSINIINDRSGTDSFNVKWGVPPVVGGVTGFSITLVDQTGTVFDDFTVPTRLDSDDFSSMSVVIDIWDLSTPGIHVRIAGPIYALFSGVDVAIDIKPGSDPNCFNLNSHGVIPVAVLGSDTFDVSTIDVSTLSFGGLGLRVRGNGNPMCSLDDPNSDGYWDLVCQFEDDPTLWEPGNSEAELRGALLDGTQIRGTDDICVIP